MPPFTLQGRKRLLRFHGPCLKALPYCQAMCCREWDAELGEEEFKSGFYQVEVPPGKTKNGRRVHYLKKRKNGACIYLRPDNRCSIYPTRPRVCRDFTCRTGWKLSSAAPGRKRPSEEMKIRKNVQRRFMEKIPPGVRFTPDRNVRLMFCHYQPEQKKIVFIKQLKKGSVNAITHSFLPSCRLDEGGILRLLSLFTSKNNLASIRRRFNQTGRYRLSFKEIAEFARIFIDHRIILPFHC